MIRNLEEIIGGKFNVKISSVNVMSWVGSVLIWMVRFLIFLVFLLINIVCFFVRLVLFSVFWVVRIVRGRFVVLVKFKLVGLIIRSFFLIVVNCVNDLICLGLFNGVLEMLV